jgi:Protein of unknown function (DUF732)
MKLPTRTALAMMPVVVAIAAAAIGLAPMAHADEGTFISDVAGSGVTTTSPDGAAALVRSGYVVCNDLEGGAAYITVIKKLMGYSQTGYQEGRPTTPLTGDQAANFIAAAEKNLCPGAYDNAQGPKH